MSTAPTISHGDMACEDVEALLPLVADGALAQEDEPALFEHLARCPACQASLASHDLIERTLTRGAAPAPAKVIRFHRLHWSAAALWLLCAGGLGGLAWWAQQDPAAQAPTAQVLAEQPPLGTGERSFLLRVGDELVETRAGDAAQQHGEAPRARTPAQGAVPVRLPP